MLNDPCVDLRAAKDTGQAPRRFTFTNVVNMYKSLGRAAGPSQRLVRTTRKSSRSYRWSCPSVLVVFRYLAGGDHQPLRRGALTR